jgi:hypothetical protein
VPPKSVPKKELKRIVVGGIKLSEVRPGVVRKVTEWPTELWVRMVVAARARSTSTSTLMRAVITDFLLRNTLVPAFVAPPVEVSPQAFDIGSHVVNGNEKIESIFGPGSSKIAELFAASPNNFAAKDETQP